MAASEITLMSHASAISHPPPIAAPLIAAITGTRDSSSALKMIAPRCHKVSAILPLCARSRRVAGALREITQVGAAAEMLSGSGYDDDSIL